jgi:hypothetical protein
VKGAERTSYPDNQSVNEHSCVGCSLKDKDTQHFRQMVHLLLVGTAGKRPRVLRSVTYTGSYFGGRLITSECCLAQVFLSMFRARDRRSLRRQHVWTQLGLRAM